MILGDRRRTNHPTRAYQKLYMKKPKRSQNAYYFLMQIYFCLNKKFYKNKNIIAWYFKRSDNLQINLLLVPFRFIEDNRPITNSFHWHLSLANGFSWLQLLLLASVSFSYFLLQVWADFLRLSCEFNSMADFEMSPSRFCRVYPIHLNFLWGISVLTGVCFALYHRDWLEIVTG